MKKNSSNLNYLTDYSMFKSVKEMDEAISNHIQRNQYEMNETDRTVLMTLSRYSVKYRGVAHLKVSTIAKIVGKSTITVRRTLNKLASLHIIRKQTFMREKTGGNGANIYIILPFNDSPKTIDREEPAKPTQTSVKESEEIDEPINSISSSSNYILETAKAVKNAIPAVIYDTLSPFFNAKDLQRITGVIFRAKTAKVRLETHKDAFTSLFLDVIRRYKQGGITSLDGYIYASVRRLSRRLYLVY